MRLRRGDLHQGIVLQGVSELAGNKERKRDQVDALVPELDALETQLQVAFSGAEGWEDALARMDETFAQDLRKA